MAKPKTDYENIHREKHSIEGNVLRPPTDRSKLKKIEPDKIHDGHRERLRRKFLNHGLETFDDHTILELLLSYSIPRKDINAIAHDLINNFGTLADVFDARIEDLCEIKGISEYSATLIKLMPSLFRMYEINKLNSKDKFLNTADLVVEYVSPYFAGLTEEQLYALYLDEKSKVLGFERISMGNKRATTVEKNLIVKYAFKYNSSRLILIHNHPSNILAPSKNDVEATMSLGDTLDPLGIVIVDHLIIGTGKDYFSFRKNNKWRAAL